MSKTKPTNEQHFKYEAFALEIKKKRLEQMSRELRTIGLRELSREIGVSLATISRVLRGRKIELETVLTLCIWLGVDINQFIKK